MKVKIVIISSVLLALGCLALRVQAAADSNGNQKPPSSSGSSTATQSRQSAASMIGTIGSLVPGLITNVAPLVLLFGLGALMMPALGMGAMGLLRESRRSSNDQPLGNGAQLPSMFAQYAARPLQPTPQDIYYYATKRSFPSLMPQVSTASLVRGLQDILERALRAIDNADKRYN